MSQALYRTYRPKTFSELTGQEHVSKTIQNQIVSGNVAHAYLFSGPRGIGKTTIARLLAKAVNCTGRKEGDSEPCNLCAACKQFDAGSSLYITEIDAASNTGVDNVRENIIEAVRFTPPQGVHRVFIVDEVHMLSMSAFNALLKTLEEPPANVIFVLATTEIHKIPATIISRCQRFDFHRIDRAKIIDRLKLIADAEDVQVKDDVLVMISRLSDGCLRDAESLLGQVFALGEKNVTADIASLILPSSYIVVVREMSDLLLEKKLVPAVELINKFVEEGGQMKPFLGEMIEFVREQMLQALSSGDHKLNDFILLLDGLLDVRAKSAPEMFPQLPFEIFCVLFCENGQETLSGNKIVREPDGRGGEKQKEKKDELSVSDSNSGKTETVTFSIEDLQSKWRRCCDVVSRTHIALPLVLQNARPIGIFGNKIHVAFTHRFHFETMSQRKNLDVLSKAIAEVIGLNVEVIPIFEQSESEKVVGELAQAFGGAVVE